MMALGKMRESILEEAQAKANAIEEETEAETGRIIAEARHQAHEVLKKAKSARRSGSSTLTASMMQK